VDLREIAVEHDDVVAVNGHVTERVGAVERDVDRDALPSETFGYGGGEPPVIFSNQNPHLFPWARGQSMTDLGDNEVTPPVTGLSPPTHYKDRDTLHAVSRRSQIMRLIPLSATIVGVALLAAGCGATKTTSTSGSLSKSPPGDFVANAYKYAACMRSHGVANFPDPKVTHTAGGTQVAIHAVGPNSPQFNTAAQACRGILPPPSAADQAQQAADQRRHAQDLVSFARCLRGHGITRFPDPNAQGQLSLSQVEALGIDLQAPSFRAAALACVPASNGSVTRAAVLQATSGNPQQAQSGSSSSEGTASSP
jgi:hypothetical protein